MLQNTMALAHAWVLHTSPRFDVEQQQRYRDLSDQLRQAGSRKREAGSGKPLGPNS